MGVPSIWSESRRDDVSLALASEEGWRAFLVSWKWAAILVVGCGLGLLAIFATHPFSSPSVSERVSDKLGRSASCVDAGQSQVTGVRATLYKCTFETKSGTGTTCFARIDGQLRQFSGSRELGC